MGPKTEKRRSTQEEISISLGDPVNTEDWKCAVALIVEGSQKDAALTRRFAEEASMKARKEVKSIDFESDVMKIVKNFITGEISHRFSFLLNFSAVFEEAGEYVKNAERIPVNLMVKIIKAMVFMLRKEDELERKGRMLCQDNPIEIMAGKPFVPLYGRDGTEKDDDKGRRKSVKNGMRIKPPTPAKEDTKLLRRGEQVRDLNIIDDVPGNSFFQLYIALTGFREPDLALEMLKEGVPLHAVVCLQSSCPVTPMTPSLTLDFDAYWTDFLHLLWSTRLTHYFKDVVFQVYSPAVLPTDEKQLRSFIFREISFLMYDLSDLKHQLRHYHRHMRLWNVSEPTERIESDWTELEQLPHHCITIPLIMQSILDALCGEDDEEVEEQYSRNSLQDSSTFSMSTTPLAVTPVSKTSFASLIPLTSTVRLPTPQWSTIIDTDEKLLLYNKMLALDELYDLEEGTEASGSGAESPTMNVCSVKKRRLYCENLDFEIESHSQGLLVKLWRNYPRQEKGDHTPSPPLNYPELTLNYILYIIWIMRMEETRENHDLVSVADSVSDISEIRFTVTDGSRIALQKMNRPNSFFSPSPLKIVPSEMLTSISAPQLRRPAKFSWTEKSFVSNFHIPLKYLQGASMGVFDDLREYLGEEAFSGMKDYDFIEELNRSDLIRRIQETGSDYDSIRHAYSPLTDCIYIVMKNNPTVNGVYRDVYNVMLTTPVGLRDFYNYILDDEREWLKTQNLGGGDGRIREGCPDSMYNPTPDFRGFTEHDFWHEDSIKYATYEGEVMESVIQRTASSEPSVKRRTTEHSTVQFRYSSYAEPGEPYRFVGFDFEPGAVQYSGVDTTFKGPDNCSIRASLQERLYGTQQLGVHVQQGGHHLHLYSYVCPQPHLDQPYTCHVEYGNGAILAFCRRILVNEDVPPEGSAVSETPDEKFAYDMKVSFPHGLTVTTVREHVNPCYIKQSYRKYSADAPANEKSRLFLPNGSIVRMLTDNTVQILKWDTSIVTASLDDMTTTDSESVLHFQSYDKVSPTGCRCTVIDGEITEMKQYQIMTKTEKETQQTYYRRMDGTCYVTMEDGSICVEFPDGSKICTYLKAEEQYPEDEAIWDGEDAPGSVYTVVHMKIVMEHPNYATAIYDTCNSTWRLNLPRESEMEIDSRGFYQVHVDGQTELDITTKAIRMWRYSPRDEFIISTVADLTVFGKESQGKYCTTTDCRGKRFTIEASGTCYVTESDVWNEYGSSTSFENQSEDATEPKRYFVVRRDLSGFEIVHTNNVKREIETAEPEVIVHSQKLKTGNRYFAILRETQTNSVNWTVKSITPKTKYSVTSPESSSTYGKPPSWMHPFPKTKPKPPKPEILHGRILLETKPTDCPNPKVGKGALYDTSDCPRPGPSLAEDVKSIMRRVADQDQEILREIYYAALTETDEVGKARQTGNPELEKYLSKSEYHVKRRKDLKNCIRYKKIPKYFDYPPGIAWYIIQSIIDGILSKKGEHKPEAAPIADASGTSKESSEVEYNLEWSTEPSYSDLSHRSDFSAKTAPEMRRAPQICFLPVSRNAKSEPIYKMEDFPNANDDLSYVPGYSFTPPSSEICSFTKDDILTLEKKSSPNDNEPEVGVYELEDLINLGLV